MNQRVHYVYTPIKPFSLPSVLVSIEIFLEENPTYASEAK